MGKKAVFVVGAERGKARLKKKRFVFSRRIEWESRWT